MTWKIYIAPIVADNTYEAYQDVSFDVLPDSLGSITIDTQKNEYDVGLPAVGSINLSLRNITGKYSDVGSSESIFSYRRSGSKLKITWHENIEPICGFAVCGDAVLGSELIVFEGLLDDLDAEQTIKTNTVEFTILGKESIFAKTETPFASLTVGDLMSEAIYTVLNQVLITDMLTVDDANFVLGRDQTLDNIDDFENTTVEEALKDLLEMSNSILLIQDDTVYISDRSPSIEVKKIFRGQGSVGGAEDIQDIKGITNGQSKVFNYWVWESTSNINKTQTSIDAYGISKKEIAFSQITNSTKIDNILEDYADVFANRRLEMRITTQATWDTLALVLLDKVQVDYPVPLTPAELGGEIPIWGYFQWGAVRWPSKLWNFQVTLEEYFKILTIKINITRNTIEFFIREIDE